MNLGSYDQARGLVSVILITSVVNSRVEYGDDHIAVAGVQLPPLRNTSSAQPMAPRQSRRVAASKREPIDGQVTPVGEHEQVVRIVPVIRKTRHVIPLQIAGQDGRMR